MGMRTVVVCVLLVLSSVASGAVVSFDLSIEFSGATPPVGAAPWLNATFDDEGSSGSVLLTLTTPGLTDIECVSNWMFNLDPSLDPTNLQFSAPTKTGSFDDPLISTVVDNFKADGAGYFDIWFAFTTGGGSDLNKRFGVGDAVEYTITTTETGASLTAESFDFLCTPADHGPFLTAAHVQSIGGDEDSGWTTAPEPATLSLLTIGGGLLLIRRRKRENL